MDNQNQPYKDPSDQVQLFLNNESITPTDPISLDIPDEDLEPIIDKRIKDDIKYYEKEYNLKERRDKNFIFRFGRQLEKLEKLGKIKESEARSSDNAIYEIEGSLKPLSVSKLPDIIITPGGPEPERQQSAKDLTIVINDSNKLRENRENLGLAFSHHPVYFTAVEKARWDSSKGKYGDYRFDVKNPTRIIVDHTATSRNVDDMGHIAEIVPITKQEMIMKFPKKKREIIEQAKLRGVIPMENYDWKDMATEVNMYEVWFDWYKRKDTKELLNRESMLSIDEPGVKWEKVCGVLWKYEHLILDKMLDPNYDHEGEEKIYSYLVPGDETTKREVTPEEMMMAALTGQEIPNISKERIYHNYFLRPHKPYFFYGYDQWGKTYLDETSRIEQNLRNQENLDDQNKVIVNQVKKREKHIWSQDSGLDKTAIQKLDMDADNMDVLVQGDPNQVHKSIQPERPDAPQFNALEGTRSRMYAIAHATAVRGQLQSDVATNNQIGREADYSVSDDLTEATINASCEWKAKWHMQFIKLRYTNEHMREIVGPSGESTYIRLRRDTLSEGMEVRIKSSSTDKLKAQRNAMESAKLGPPFTNPLDFFRDMDLSDPEGRTERGLMFSLDPMGYFTKYILSLQNSQSQVQALNTAMPQMQPPVPPPAPSQPSPAPQNPSPQDTSAVATEQPLIPQGSVRTL